MQTVNAFNMNCFVSALRLPSRRQLAANLLSLCILLLALCTLWLGHWLPSESPKKVELREVALVLPPPQPPPPPPEQQQLVETPVPLQIQGAGSPVPIIEVVQKLDPIKPEIPVFKTENTQWQSLDVDWNALDLNQLDDFPSLLTPLRISFPKSLSRRGITRVLVKLDVVIDEQGQVTLVDIVQNPHPELNTEIHKLVRNSRFSAPKKDNQAVRARFIWPVEIEA